jgi:molybdopterin biosynthesis enzyme MoaB
MALEAVREVIMQEVEGIGTIFGKSDERSVNSKGKLHRQLRRHNACDNKNAIEKKLGFLEVSLDTCQVFHLDHKGKVRVRIC